MKTTLKLLIVTLGLAALSAAAQVPGIISHQGKVTVNGTNYTGSGQFKFALVDATGTTTYWSNDGTSSGGAAPTSAVTLATARGVFSVNLGDTNVANMTQAIPAAAFTNSAVYLRTWFNDGVDGSQLLAPDRQITSVGYALVAANFTGTLSLAQLPTGVVTNNETDVNLTGTFTGNGASSFIGDGSGLTGLDAGQLTGTVPLAQLPTDVLFNYTSGVDLTGTFTGNFSGDGDFYGYFTGDGSGLTGLDLTQSTGVITQDQLPPGVLINGSGASGQNFIALGDSTTANGYDSTALGASTTASGNFSTALGQGTTASGDSSTAMGYSTTASGNFSTAMGDGTRASGSVSTAMGDGTTASGSVSTAMGFFTVASGLASTAMGIQTTASGDYSTAMGLYTTATNIASTAMGYYTSASGSASTAMGYNAQATNDNSFVWADGQGGYFTSTTNNEFSVRAGGGVRFVTGGAGLTVDGQRVLTNGDSMTGSFTGNGSGLTGLNAANLTGAIGVAQLPAGVLTNNASGVTLSGTFTGDGSGLTGLNGQNLVNGVPLAQLPPGVLTNGSGASGSGSIALGYNTMASGTASTALGFGTTANSQYSTAMGYGTTASGWISTAMGQDTTASGDDSTALGMNTTASGNACTAMGAYTVASGTYSTAMGVITTASGYDSTALGYYTTASGNYSTALGHFAQATNDNSFVWADGQNGYFTSTTNNEFSVRAGGGVRFVTGGAGLTVDGQRVLTNGDSISGSFTGNGSGLTGLNAANLTGAIGVAQLPDGVLINYTSGVDLNGTFTGSFSGDGSGLTGLPVATLPAGVLTNGSGASGYDSIALGNTTTASGSDSIALGAYTTASGYASTALGDNTMASGYVSTAMGFATTASGPYSTAMGFVTTASGYASTAMGYYAQATNDYSFVWADAQGGPFTSTTINQFSVRAGGGVRFVTGGAGLTVDGQRVLTNGASGVNLSGNFSGNGSGLTSLPTASGSQAGALSSADWNTFNSKVSATRNIATTAPLTGGGTLAGDLTLSLPVATSSANGYLASTDWSTFNGKIGGSGTANYVPKFTASGTVSNSALFSDASGNVGIGTTGPNYPLQISKTIASNTTNQTMLALTGNYGSGTGAGFGVGINFGGTLPANILIEDAASIYGYNSDVEDNGFALGFATRPNAATHPVERLTILRGGNVGIGTTAPSGLLHLSTGPAWSSFNYGAGLVVDGARHNAIGLFDYTSSNPWAIANTAGKLVFSQMPALGNTTTPPNPCLAISTNGNVGIGTTTPLNTLHVVGPSGGISARFSDAINSTFFIGHTAPGIVQLGTGGGPLQFLNGMPGSGGSPIMTILANGNVGIGTTNPAYTLQVNGSVAGTSAYNNLSDARLKQDVQPIGDALAIVEALRGVTYNWNQAVDPSLKLDDRNHVGFLAQEVEKVLPQAVSTANDARQTKSVAYSEVIPVLNEAIKQQQTQIETLQAENDELKARLDALEAKLGK